MTRIPPSLEKATPLAVFLSSVCPTLPILDDNTHFSLENSLSPSEISTIENFNWPLTGLSASVAVKVHLDHTYLNVARPPFQQDAHHNIESTTYVSLPLHYSSLFTKLVTEGGGHKQDGGKHIGANENPLLHDPYRLVQLNPGCISSMITLPSQHKSAGQPALEVHNPFNKMTSSINRLLRIGVADTSLPSDWQPLLSDVDSDCHSSGSIKNLSNKPPRESSVISSLIDFDKKFYSSQVTAASTAKLLVSSNVNVLNVFAIGEDHDYKCTSTFQSTGQIFPQSTAPVAPSTHSSSASSALIHSLSTSYKKVIEVPILRIQLGSHVLVTSMTTISNEMLVIVGLSNGDILVVNLMCLTYRHFDDLGYHDITSGCSSLSSVNAVTSLCTVSHPSYPLLLFAGYATGEVVILNPSGAPKSLDGVYTKNVVGNDRFITYFKRFDLSGWGKSEVSATDEASPAYLVGQFKISHKPITSIASTIPHKSLVNNPHKPMIVALASEDGLVRFLDLVATFGRNYVKQNDFYNLPILTDVVSNYFQDGVRDIDFSPDNNFFVSCGKGDLVEIFRMSYFNVNALLQRDSGVTQTRGERSRSGTIASSNSSNMQLLVSYLGYGSSPTSVDLPRLDTSGLYYAPAIKDIAIVSRLKGHLNVVQKVSFIAKNQYFNPTDASASGNYALITCGNDGKINVWDFNNKALPRIKKSHFTTTAKRLSHLFDSSLTAHLLTLSARGVSNSNSNAPRAHRPTRPFMNAEEFQLNTSFSKLGINNLLSPNSHTYAPQENSSEQLQTVLSLYRSLHEMRLKKHYAKQKKELRTKYSCVIHGIVNDKDLPSIQVPLLTMDLSCLVKNGHISNYHCDSKDFWVFSKSGDIFRYNMSL